MAFTVNMGVAPLLFLQVLYRHPMYVSPKTKDWPLLQCYRAGFTFDEIAPLFGLSRTEAKFRVHRAYIVANL